jgi:hypothetical protein
VGPPNVPAPPRRRIGRSARPRASRVHTLAAVCTARLLLLQVVALLLSPALPPRQYKFHATCRSPGPAGLRAPWKRGQGPRGACPARGRARPQPPRGYRGDNITMIPGPRLRESKRPALFHRLLTPCCARRVPLAAEAIVLPSEVRESGACRTPRDCHLSRHASAALDGQQTVSDCGGHKGIREHRLSDKGNGVARAIHDNLCPQGARGDALEG